MLFPRLICARATISNQLLGRANAVLPRIAMASSSSSPSQPEQDFFTKNSRLNRPILPYTIYQPQLTSVLSISHRVSGVALSVGIYAMGISQLFASTPFAHQLESLSTSIPSILIITSKILVASGFGFHFANGIRHLFWDMGFGFGLKELYTSGYAVLGITALVTLYAIFNL
uniref:Succinate dehydrogenase complex subunit C n=1 Tax=Tetranychus urticae TaxID=32264 RepID=A0A6S4RE96_TETUR|nr:succinate dehydrogenase complex subunit C [Tetranychus urticae]